ncbi:hypothetical protein Peur_035946 [Populus x canadensis]
MGSMEKGRVWVNGHRYCTVHAKGNCTGCSYSATLRPARCQLGCGQPPRKWVSFLELGDPRTRRTSNVPSS